MCIVCLEMVVIVWRVFLFVFWKFFIVRFVYVLICWEKSLLILIVVLDGLLFIVVDWMILMLFLFLLLELSVVVLRVLIGMFVILKSKLFAFDCLVFIDFCVFWIFFKLMF